MINWDKKTRQPADASYRLADFIFLIEVQQRFQLLWE